MMCGKSLFRTIILSIFFFVVIYPLKFVFFPYVTTRVLLGVIGTPLFLKHGLVRIVGKNNNILASLLLVSVLAIIAILVNGTSDLVFVLYPLTVLFIFSSCTLLIYLIKKGEKEVTVENISFYFISAVNIQLILTLLFFLFPSLKDVMLSLLTAELQPLSLDRAGDMSFRITGFGSQYATAGMVNCAAVVVSAYMFRRGKKYRLYYAVSLLLLFTIGNALSRTTLAGFAVAAVYLVVTAKKSTLLASIKYIIPLVVALFFVSRITISDEMDQQLRFAFEIFYSYFEEGTVETGSSNALFDSYSIVPNNPKTWIIGDGRFDGDTSDSNYMEVDAGFSRMIFYFGIIGLISIVIFHYRLKRSMENVINDRALPSMLFILFLILNFKGYCLYALYFGLYLFIPHKNKELITKQIKSY